jgi:hypothetical protein
MIHASIFVLEAALVQPLTDGRSEPSLVAATRPEMMVLGMVPCSRENKACRYPLGHTAVQVHLEVGQCLLDMEPVEIKPASRHHLPSLVP